MPASFNRHHANQPIGMVAFYRVRDGDWFEPMSTFFVIVAIPERYEEAKSAFERGLVTLREFAGAGAPVTTWRKNNQLVASAPQQNGSGGGIAIDAATGSYLIDTGVWFHGGKGGKDAPTDALTTYVSQGTAALVAKLEGSFGFVVGDGRSSRTAVVTDLLGDCHIYERHLASGVAISNSSLLLAKLDETAVDPTSLRLLIATGAIYDERRTLFGEVKKLPASTVCEYHRGVTANVYKYWNIANLPLGSLRSGEAADALWARLTEAMRHIGAAYPRVVCDITGGYDSRTVLAAALGARINVATTVTGRAGNPDVVVGRQLAQAAGKDFVWQEHQPTPTLADLEALTLLTDGEADVVEYSRVANVHRQLMTEFDISLNGSILEVGRGYWWELLPTLGKDSRGLDAEMLSRRRLIGEPFDASIFGNDPTPELLDNVSTMIRYATHGLESAPLATQMDASYLLTRMQRWHGRIASSTNRLWPSLAPGLMRSVLETLLTVEPGTRVRSHLVRLMLARHQPHLAAIPLERGHPCIPFTWSAAHRFWPLVPLYAKRATNKLYRMARNRPRVASTDAPSIRMQLWTDDAIAELLNPPRMKLADHLDTAALRRFLEASRMPGFAYDEQWRCLLSAELALRAAAQNR